MIPDNLPNRFPALKVLLLQRNFLMSMPWNSMSAWKNMSRLHLHSNRIAEVPQRFEAFASRASLTFTLEGNPSVCTKYFYVPEMASAQARVRASAGVLCKCAEGYIGMSYCEKEQTLVVRAMTAPLPCGP